MTREPQHPPRYLFVQYYNGERVVYDYTFASESEMQSYLPILRHARDVIAAFTTMSSQVVVERECAAHHIVIHHHDDLFDHFRMYAQRLNDLQLQIAFDGSREMQASERRFALIGGH